MLHMFSDAAFSDNILVKLGIAVQAAGGFWGEVRMCKTGQKVECEKLRKIKKG